MRTLTILGSTGSIGRQALDVIATHHPDVRLGFLTTNRNATLLAEQVARYHPYGVAIVSEDAYRIFREISNFDGPILCGTDGILDAAAWEENDIVLSALVGFAGVAPTLAAIERGTTIALANKESLVVAGELITARARERNVPILAVDSEHSAILQCIVGESHSSIEQIILTASGGPFRTYSSTQLMHVTPDDALQHPTWTMGAKITIDSATLMNKGFEVIEAHWLFDLPPERIGIVIHPQSIVHSFVMFCDGSVKAQLSLPDMRLPIHYALTYPERRPTALQRIDWDHLRVLEFEQPDPARFPCLQLALDALATGGSAPAILNAANEVAVTAFLQRTIHFPQIPRIVEQTLATIAPSPLTSLEDLTVLDRCARQTAWNIVRQIQLEH